MEKKRLKNVFKRALAGVLSATMVLGMTASSTLAGTAIGTLPTAEETEKGNGETLTNATELTRESLAPNEINIITKDITNKLGNAIGYKQGVTYIAGYVQTADTEANPDASDIAFVKGLRMNVTFSRAMQSTNVKGIDRKNEEYFKFYSSDDIEAAVDVFGDENAEALCTDTLNTYTTQDSKTYDYITADPLYNMTDEDLNTSFLDAEQGKYMVFIIALYNLQDDIDITYSFGTGESFGNGYMPKDASSEIDTRTFAKDGIKVAPSLIRLKRYNVVFDTDTNKAKLPVGKDFTVTKPADQVIKDKRDNEGNNTDVIDTAGGIAPAITEENAGYIVEGWYKDPECKYSFDMNTPITKTLYNWNSKTNANDANNDTLKLYAKYTAKNTANLTVHCYEEGTTKDVRPTADQGKLNKTGLTFGTTESITAPTVSGYTLKAGTTTPLNATIDSLNKEVTFYYTANTDTQYTIRVHKTKLDDAAQTESYVDGEVQDIVMDDGVSGKELTIDPANIQEVKDATVGFKFDSTNAGNNLTETVAGDGSTVYNVYYNRNKYKVTFDTQTKAPATATASSIGEKELFYGSTLTGGKKPANPTLTGADGYEFKEWQTKNGDTYSAWNLDNDPVEGNMTLYADYAEKANISYTLCYYNKNTSAKIAEDKTVGNQIFNAVIAITPDTLSGYTYDSSSETNLSAVKLDTVGKVINLYYVGKAKNYSIETYKQNTAGNGFDKDAALTKTIAAKIGDEIAAITPAAVPGFTFDTTNTENVLSGTVPVTGDLVLKVYYTRNKIAITFNPDGNKPDPSSEIDTSKLDPDKLTQDIPYDTSPENPGTPSTEGYDFDGWSTDGTTPFTPGTDKLTEGETLVPTWTAKSDVSYTVNYYLDGTTTKVPGIAKNPLNVTGKTYNTEVTENAPAVAGYTAKAPTSTKIKLNGYDKTITFYYTANDATYQIERYDMNVNGNYDGVTPTTTAKTGKVGATVKAEIAADTDEFTHDTKAANKVEEGEIPATGELVLKVYYSRKQYTVTFDVSTSKTIKDNSATLSTVDSQKVYYGATATKPTPDPKITNANSKNFSGWFTEADGETKYAFDTKITKDVTIYAQLTDKIISISFDNDAFDDKSDIYRRYLVGGPNAVGGIAGDKGRKGDQLNFTLTVDGETLKTTAYDSYTAEQKAKLDSVTFSNAMIGGFQKILGTNEKGANYRVADIAAGGMASARYSGVQEVTLNYLGTTSTNTAKIVVPGDTDANGIINVADLSNMAQLLRGTLTASGFGEAEPYVPYLIDMDGNKMFIVADISIAASMIRNEIGYTNSFRN